MDKGRIMLKRVLSNPQSDLEEGQRVRIKYHPKMKGNARLVCKEHPTKPTFTEDNRS